MDIQLWLLLMVLVCAAGASSYNVCIAPVGDSLTQGVDPYGSYRPVLLALLKKELPDFAFASVGTRKGVCKMGAPGVIVGEHGITSDVRHQAYCGANSAILLRSVQSSGFVWPLSCDVRVALLLVGHNDAFQVAKLCKAREWSSDAGVSRCAKPHLLADFADNLRRLLQHLVALRTSRILVGLNPPTGFPAIDVVLHSVIQATVAEEAFQGIVSTVSFDNFVPRKHTFDTTHPNAAGVRLLASAWFHDLVPFVRHSVKNATTPPPQGSRVGSSSVVAATIERTSREPLSGLDAQDVWTLVAFIILGLVTLSAAHMRSKKIRRSTVVAP